MNKKKLAIYICIIIVFGSILLRPQRIQAACFGPLMNQLTEVASHFNTIAEARAFLEQMWKILSSDITPCDENGNPVVIPTIDPNAPTPTIDPNAPTPPPGDGTLAFFCQGDPRLQTNISPRIVNLGCGPTSMSIINCTKTGFDNSSKMSCPTQAGNFAATLQSRYCAWNGSSVRCYGSPYGMVFTNEVGRNTPAVLNILKEAGRHVEIITADLAEWDRKIKNGNLLLTYAPDTPCSEGCASPKNRKLAHIFVVDAVDLTTGKARLRDPIHCSYLTEYNEIGGGRWLTATSTQTADLQSFQIRVAFAVR